MFCCLTGKELNQIAYDFSEQKPNSVPFQTFLNMNKLR